MNKQSEARLYSTVDHSKFHHKEPRRNQNGGFNSYIDIDENTKETPAFSGTSALPSSVCPTPLREAPAATLSCR